MQKHSLPLDNLSQNLQDFEAQLEAEANWFTYNLSQGRDFASTQEQRDFSLFLTKLLKTRRFDLLADIVESARQLYETNPERYNLIYRPEIQTHLYECVRSRRPEFLEIYLQHPDLINLQDNLIGETHFNLIHFAAFLDNTNNFKQLLAKNIDFTHVDNRGNNILHTIGMAYHEEEVSIDFLKVLFGHTPFLEHLKATNGAMLYALNEEKMPPLCAMMGSYGSGHKALGFLNCLPELSITVLDKILDSTTLYIQTQPTHFLFKHKEALNILLEKKVLAEQKILNTITPYENHNLNSLGSNIGSDSEPSPVLNRGIKNKNKL